MRHAAYSRRQGGNWMATGIIKRHTQRCRSRDGDSCSCEPRWLAWVWSAREGRKIKRQFASLAEAKSWRGDAKRELDRGTVLPGRDGRRLADAVGEFVEGMRSGEVRPKRRLSYKPGTVRAYDRAVRLWLRGSALGSMRVSEVRHPDVQDFADSLIAAGLAPTT